MIHVQAIHRYPVNGLSFEALDKVGVVAGETLPFDRHWAIENGPSSFRPRGTGSFAQNRLPDIDEKRTAGGIAHRFRRRRGHSHDQRSR